MKHHRKVLTLHVPGRTGFVNITEVVAAAVRASGVQEGLCLVNTMHITSSVFINDEESGLQQDYLRWLEKLAPFHAGPDPAQGGYLHNQGAHLQTGIRLFGRARLNVASDRWEGEDNIEMHQSSFVVGRPIEAISCRCRTSVYRTVPRTVLPLASLAETEPREQVFYGEFDGLRDKRILIKIIGE
jgi:thiamine phosphate synthase YjbQ (UPF0047 family)